MTYLRFLNLKCSIILLCLVSFHTSNYSNPFNSPTPISQADGDADNDGIPDFEDLDSDNDGILDMDENVICETVDLSPFNGSTDALTDFNAAMITVGGINGALIQVEDPLEINGSASIDEFFISNEHVLDTGNDSTSLLLGVAHQPGETGQANSLGTNYTFSKPVCGFNFKLYDIDRTDEVLINASLNGVPVTYTVTRLGPCLNYDAAASTINSICNVQARPSNGNVAEHSATIVFDGCIDRLEFDLYDFGTGNGGSFTFLPAPDPVCVGLDTDLDGIPDFIDLDSDNDGIPDAIEACSELTLTLEDCTLDSNGDGVYEMDGGVSTGVLVDRCADAPVDTDMDGIPDFLDLDSDGDGCSDAIEGGTIDTNPNVTDTDVSDGYADPAVAVNDCGLIFLADGVSTECPTPTSDIWVDATVDGCEVGIAGLTIMKVGTLDVGADGEASVGDIITYTFEVCNTGTLELTMVTVDDPLVTVMGGPVTIAAMACDNMSFTGSYAITADDITNAGVMNTATAMGMDPDGNPVDGTDDEAVPIVASGSIAVVKTGVFNDENANGVAEAGETISYTFVVTNPSAVELTGITITDPLVTVIGGPITLAAGAMDATTFTGTYTITATDITNGNVANTATATGMDPSGETVMGDSMEDVPLAGGTPGISIVKTGVLADENGNGFSEAGETITYTFVVNNTGDVELTGVTVMDPLVTVMGGPITLAGGASDATTFTGTYTITATDIANGNVANTATASGMDPSGETVMGDSMEDVPLAGGTPGISIVKTGVLADENGNGFAEAGETITYTFVVNNTGDVELTGVTVMDPLVTVMGGPITLAGGASDATTFTGTYTITATDITNGTVANTATASGMDPTGGTVMEESMEDIPITGGTAGISIEKMGMLIDSNGDGFAQAGETIAYTFTVINTGTLDLLNVTVTDPVVTVVGGPIDLPAGQTDSSTFTGSYTLTQADIDAGPFMNTATVSGEDPSGNPIDEMDEEETDLPQNPAVMIIKTGMLNDENGNGISDVGETITYIFIVTNTGNTTLTGVIVTDPLVDVTGSPMTLAPGDVDNTSYTGTYVLTQVDIEAGVVNNVATVEGADPDSAIVSDTDDEQTPIIQDPNILLTKTGTFQDENGDGFADAGETIAYTFVVMNTGNVTLTNVTVNDPLVTVIGGPIAVFMPGQTDTDTFTGTYSLTQADIDAGEFENIAVASGTDPTGAPIEDESDDPQNPTDDDPDGDGDPDDPTVIPTSQNPMISILKTGTFVDGNGDGFAQPGETITYAFTITNTGNVTLTDITVTDNLVTVNGGPIPLLAPGQSDNSTFTASYTITQADIDSGGIENSALATGTDPNGDPVTDISDDPQNPEDVDPDGDGNPDDPTFTPVPLNPMISILKTGTFQDENGDGFSQPGETISYSFVITNTGNVTLTNVNVTDALVTVSGTPIPSLAPGESNSTAYTATYTITQADIDAGVLENTAIATGTDPSGNPTMDMSDDPQNPTDDDPDGDGDPDDPTMTTLPQNPDISLLKVGTFNDENGDGFGQPGETISYAFTVSNTGNVTLTNVTVNDPLVAVQGGPIATFPPGAVDNTTFSGTYSITQLDIDTGLIENTALATGTDPNGNTVEDDSDDPQNPADDDPDGDGDPDDPTIIPVGQNPLIEIVKIGTFQDENGDGFADIGETIRYQFIVTNTGNVTLTNVVVTDELVLVSGGVITTLSPGEIDDTMIGIYVLTEADLANLSYVNSATATGQDPNGMDVTDISDDPQNPTDNDTEGDGEPDDPTVVPYCGIVLDMVIAPPFQCLTDLPLDADASGTVISPTGYETIYLLTSQPGGIIEQISTNPNNFVVSEVGVYTIHTFVAELDSPADPNFFDLATIAFGQTQIIDVFNFIRTEICADLNLVGTTINVGICNVNLEKEQVFEELFEDEDVALTFDLTITNNGDYDLIDLNLEDDIVFLPIAYPLTAMNENNMEVTITNVDATQLPTLNPGYNGASDIDLLDGMSGFLRPGESFIISFTTETSVFKYRQAFNIFQTNQAFISGTHIDPNGNIIDTVDDFSDDPTVFTDNDIDGDGDPDDPTPILIPVCDELVCNNDLVISLPANCRLEVTPDMLLENPSPLGNYTINFFNPDGEPIGNILTEEFVFVQLLFNLDCSQGSCWGHAVIEANQVPQLEAPCEVDENGVIPADCIIWCDPGYYPSIIVSPQEVEDAFGDCGPDLLSLNVDESRTGDLCDENGEIVTLVYTAKVERHGRVETVDVLTQQYAIQKINIDIDENGINAIFSFPEDVIIDCDSAPDMEIDSSIALYSPEYLSYLIDGFDAFPFYYNIHEIVADTTITADTIQVVDETMFTLRDTMVKEDIGGEEVWVVITLVDKPLVDSISFDTLINNFAHPKVPVFDINCNTASSYTDIEFEACGNGRKIVRTWTVLDWCDSDIFISGKQTIEIRDLTAPQIVVESNGELVPVTMLNDVIVNIEPFTCSGIYKLPTLNIVDNCDTETSIEWYPEDGVVGADFITDLWFEQSPIHVIGTVYDDCMNSTEFHFNIIIQDDTPPVAVCETALNVSLTHNALEQSGIAKVYATDIDEGSHDSECGKVTLSVVRLEDWSDVVRDCQNRIVGYQPVSCFPLTNDVDLGEPANKDDCVSTGENIGQITFAGDHVKFCCEDLGKSIPVVLIVEDEQGNINQCITYVQVDDKSIPSILCTDQVVSCVDGDQLLTPAMLGASCPRENPIEVELLGESRSTNVCAGGQVVREWFIDLDHSGDFSSGDPFCTQIVSVAADDSFDPYTIKWPKYYDDKSVSGVNVECNDEGEVVETPSSVSMGETSVCVPDEVIDIPVWCDTNCGLVGYTMDSDTIIASDACLKIIRRWTIVDWCLYDPNASNFDDDNDSGRDSFIAVEDWAQGECVACPIYGPAIADPVYFRYENVEKDGYYTFDQVIVVNDDSRPEIIAPAEFQVNTSGGILKGDQANLPDGFDQNLACVGSDVIVASASDYCDGEMTGANHLQWQIYVRNGTEILASKTVRGPEATMTAPEASPGTVYEIQWIVKDGCGNETSTITEVSYVDRSAPTPFCIAGLTSSFNSTTGSVVVWATEFDFGSTDNCTPAEDLRFSIMSPGETPINPSDAAFSSQSSIEVSCANASNFTDLRVWIWDEDGNGDFCQVGIIIEGPCAEDTEDGDVENGNDDNGDDNTDGGEDDNVGSSLQIEGQVTMFDGLTMRDVDVTVSSTLSEFPKSRTTGNSGSYRFTDLVEDFNYELDAEKGDTYINGVTTLDLIGIQQHILGKNEFDSPYLIIAADANRDSKVTAIDILQLRQLVLGLISDLPETNAWTFIDGSAQFFDESNPWPFTESIEVTGLQNSIVDADFIGVKIGDVNNTANVNGLVRAEPRSLRSLVLNVDENQVERGEIISIELTSSDLKRLQGFQFTLDHSGLDLVSVKSDLIDIAEENYGKFINQTSFSWSADEALQLSNQKDETLLTLTFLSTAELNLSDALTINSSITQKEAYYKGDGGIANVLLDFNGSEGAPFTIEQNKPNPFNAETTIGITLPSAGSVNLKIHDLTGRVLVDQSINYSKGYHEYQLNADQLNQNGVYYYQVSFNGEMITKKMILLK